MVKGESLETLVQDLENELKIKGTSLVSKLYLTSIF